MADRPRAPQEQVAVSHWPRRVESLVEQLDACLDTEREAAADGGEDDAPGGSNSWTSDSVSSHVRWCEMSM